MNKSKTWCICTLALLGVILLAAGSLTAVIDPFFHYHQPLEQLQYPINNERYQNDGIVKHFFYDALITGSSMTENFKTTEFDALFGVRSVKAPYSGGLHDEIFSNLRRAVAANPDLKLVICAIDEWSLLAERELLQANGAYPTYLYDSNPFNDVEYLLNKEILCDGTLKVLDYTRSGQTTTGFDEYGSWDSIFVYDEDVVKSNYARPDKADQTKELTRELVDRLTDNMQSTVIQTALEHPEIQFIYYFPPYSILNWDAHNREGTLQRQVEAFRLASRLMLEVDNIQLYAFYNDYDTVTNLNLYRDIVHHSGAINSVLLQRIHDGQYRLTRETNDEYWQEILEYYQSYDYDALLAEEPSQD